MEVHHPKFPNGELKEKQWNEATNITTEMAFFRKSHWTVVLTPPQLYDDSLDDYKSYLEYSNFINTDEYNFEESDWITYVFPDDIQELGFYGLSCHGQLVLTDNIDDVNKAYDLIMKALPYLMYVGIQNRLPIKKELRKISHNPETKELSFSGSWGGRFEYQLPHLIMNDRARHSLLWVKGDVNLVQRAIRKTIPLPNDVHRRLRFLGVAFSSYYRLEFEIVLELLGRALELKAKSARDKLLPKLGSWKIARIWKELYDNHFISVDLYVVVDVVRHLRNITVHEGSEINKKLVGDILASIRHILALDWIPEEFDNPKEFLPDARNTWRSNQGPNILLPDLKPCPDCGDLSIPSYGCRSDKNHSGP